ncbi:hypothetical protein FOS14_04060 [Skermania sp. ID1734]|uniref:DUF6390 family protein n=1 Tax=Skermania sp. ID1734 TaxID=2597516 RepID=UPI00117FCE51|nr:DUF6390 family protein [Skermania sp. ID1734]TSE00952.1 hypothetical protein FOS14_04060 [Skermania sp. ID1734]
MAFGPGHRLFAQYVHAPNALGYCGPAEAHALAATACGRRSADLTDIARKFTGAWPYQQLIAELSDAPDPLGADVVRAYWTGSELTDRIDRQRFGEALLGRFASQAGHYWKHLTPALLDEAAPTHAFHVLGVYPWSRLLKTGMPQPLEVLDSCRITDGVVVDVNDERALVRSRRLRFEGTLALAAEEDRPLRYRLAEGAFVADLRRGDRVAVHWDFICDRLTREQANCLQHWTNWQLDRTNRRLAREQ